MSVTRGVFQVDAVLTASGKKVLGDNSGSGGASLEVGGAHWFAEAHGVEQLTPDRDEDIDGSIGVGVCCCHRDCAS
jgi:hypothetical protein